MVPTNREVAGLALGIVLMAPIALADESWVLGVVDPANANHSSVAALPSGQPAIAYERSVDVPWSELWYAWYDGTTWHTEPVDQTVEIVRNPSLAFLPTGHPAISYADYTPNYNLKYASYDGSTWTKETVDSFERVGRYSSLAILPSGYPAISYLDENNGGDVKYAWHNGAAWQTTTVDTGVDCYWGGATSLAILPSGNPAISYTAESNGDLKYAWHDGETWQTTVVTTTGPGGIAYDCDTSLAILPLGRPAISYVYTIGSLERKVRYAYLRAGGWQVETLTDCEWVHFSTSLAILPSGKPVISYAQYGTGCDRGLSCAWGPDWFSGGDCDEDNDVDLNDFVTFGACFRGSDVPVPPECECADLDGDTDVDLNDFINFASNFTG